MGEDTKRHSTKQEMHMTYKIMARECLNNSPVIQKCILKLDFFFWPVELTNTNLRQAGADDRAIKRTLLFYSLSERA